MKKLLVAAIILTNVFLACKKEDRTCSCTVTKNGTSTTLAALTVSTPLGDIPVIDTSFVAAVADVFSYDRTLTKATKKQAKNNCISYKEPYKDISTNSAPPLLLQTTETGTLTYDCKLK